ncbi:hypothetical protein UA75_18255 [Actinoalloteichus sp. GBA129-24]|nr:hypothetical protein UA75_18255 [Actinoalloteichus sp. GBA129-24]
MFEAAEDAGVAAGSGQLASEGVHRDTASGTRRERNATGPVPLGQMTIMLTSGAMRGRLRRASQIM